MTSISLEKEKRFLNLMNKKPDNNIHQSKLKNVSMYQTAILLPLQSELMAVEI